MDFVVFILEVEEMTDKEKQIEEMAKDLEQAKYWAMGTVGSLNNGFGGWYGVYMYNQCYRKQSEVAENIIAMLRAAKPVVKVHFEAYDELIENIAAEYGVEVEK